MSGDKLDSEDRWTILNSMFDELGLVRQHLHSFDLFVEDKLNEIIKEDGMDKIEPEIEGFYVRLLRIKVGEPKIREADGSDRPVFPSEARIRNLIYSVPLHLVMTPIRINEGIESEDPAVEAYIGRLPIMLKSKRCALYGKSREELIRLSEDPEDPGAYFIINGSERVIVTQEYLVSNRILVDYGRKGGPVTSIAKVFSTVAGFRSLVTVERRKNGQLSVNFFSVPRPIPLAILLKALGISRDIDIAYLVSEDPEIHQELYPTLKEGVEVLTTGEALDFIGRRVAVGQTEPYRILRAKNVLDNYLLPHLGTNSEARKRKALFLAQMALRVMELDMGRRGPDDKDHYANKRLKLAGEMLTSLFRAAFRALYRDIRYQLERGARKGKIPNLRTAMRADVITERIRHALATGNWIGGKSGVSQLLDRTNCMSTFSHLRRVLSPLIRSQAHFEARDLHATHWGKICVAPDTNVLLGDGISQVPIGDMEENFTDFSVMTVTEKLHNGVPSDLVAYQRISAYDTGKTVLEIRTTTGRSIRATEDHPFMTLRGWIEAGDLKLSDKVLIRPTLDALSLVDVKEHTSHPVLTTEDFLNGKWKEYLPENQQHLVEKDAEELTQLGILPLDTSHPKLPIIARLLGIIITDGSISNTVEFYLGSEADSIAINRDLEILGFETNPTTQKTSKYHPDKEKEPIHYQTFQTTKDGAFQRLMVALGASVGKRTEQPARIPKWISNCPLEVKREFLGGFMGGNSAVPWYYKRSDREDSYKIRIPEIENHKHPDHIDSQIKFFKFLEELFKDFEIKVNKIQTKPTKSPERTAVNLILSADKDNILRLCSNIGYRYCQEKQHKAQLISEFLAYREKQVRKRTLNRQRILDFYNQGIPPREISRQLGIGYRIVTSTIQRRGQDRKVVLPKSSWSVGKFFEETQADEKTGMLYAPLASINVADDEDLVCDFTTARNMHSFIANGFVTHNCPNETPEGPNCGLVKNLAMQAYISAGTPSEQILSFLLDLDDVLSIEEKLDHNGIKIHLDGTLVATTRSGEEIVTKFREARRKGDLSSEINIAYYAEEKRININADEGRVRRPLIIVKDGNPLINHEIIEAIVSGDLKFSELVRKGLIEFLDAEEEENAFIGLRVEDLEVDHTHLEISAAAILGICASIIPYAEHNQSPRNTYEAGMTKQALGLYASNFRFRTDRRSHILQYSQIPLVGSRSMDVIGFNERPAGQNFIVAILSFQGWNIQDAIIVNKASIDRGLARSHFFRSYIAEERKYLGGQEDKFEKPQKGVRGYRAEDVYRHLADDGICEPEAETGGGDVLIGKTSRPRFLEEYQELIRPTPPQRRETSISMRHGESGVVNTVIITETSEGNRLVKVKVRDQRIPELGDKFASRHGQKGVIGYICPQADLPFTEEGIVPDLILNPHAIPSRMTVGQILESMTGIIACEEGKQRDATLFESPSPSEISETLLKYGFSPYGESVLYDGTTGRILSAQIFIGPVYYQKLHHLVADKIHARARGPIQILTRQPTEGRAREGGLRFGEMERDCLIGHGAALLLKERLLEESDKITVFICERCGLIATYDRRKNQVICNVCRSVNTDIARISISYAFKLLLQELQSLTIRPSLVLEDNV